VRRRSVRRPMIPLDRTLRRCPWRRAMASKRESCYPMEHRGARKLPKRRPNLASTPVLLSLDNARNPRQDHDRRRRTRAVNSHSGKAGTVADLPRSLVNADDGSLGHGRILRYWIAPRNRLSS
jgi:hypothetical protein